jgi:hypothetical protein
MNIRHAAALALVGWYLMVPPQTNGQIDYTAPLSRWTVAESYDSAAPCREMLTNLRNDATSQADKATNEITAKQKQHERISTEQLLDAMKSLTAHEIAFQSACIATDDPRLREK